MTIRVRREPVEQTIQRLETYVRRMEHRYEVTSEDVLQDVREGRMKETAEIARWLIGYRMLVSLRELTS